MSLTSTILSVITVLIVMIPVSRGIDRQGRREAYIDIEDFGYRTLLTSDGS